jgi:ribonuclease R
MPQSPGPSPANANVPGEAKISVIGKGLGFIELPDGRDATVPREDLGRAFHGDTVRFQLTGKTDRFGSPEAKVLSIASRLKTRFAGELGYDEQRVAALRADDNRMYTLFSVNPNELRGAREGDKIFFELAEWPEGAKEPRARILEILGRKGDNNAEMRAIVLERGFQTGHPAKCEEEAAELKKAYSPIPADEIAARRDLRGIPLFTIDPKTAKDFDDAISLEKKPDGGWRLGVHIADVAFFVRPGSQLDKEAVDRQCSVYLVDRTVPMLPETLSNDLCSINPDEDKCAFSAMWDVSADGNIDESKPWFGRSVIRSLKRFTYEEAQDVIDGKQDGPYRDELLVLNDWAKRLEKENAAAGAISFERDEFGFELDDRGVPIRVFKRPHLATHKLVEEYMLLANRAVARRIDEYDRAMNHGNPRGMMYRVHDLPDEERIRNLQAFVRALGHTLRVSEDGDVSQQDLNALLRSVTGKPEEDLVKTAAIRSMAKAAYSIENSGHYGLAFEYYTHFTSPIRRYPDLVVHRILAHALAGERVTDHDVATFERVAARATEREVLASEAERTSVRYKQVEFMMNHIGETATGTVSGVMKTGIFVALDDTGAEGFVHVTKLGDDYYSLDEKNYRLIGQKTGKTIALGDKVRARVERADLDERKLDFVLVR